MSKTIDSMRHIRDNHSAQVVCQACGARAPIPDSYYDDQPKFVGMVCVDPGRTDRTDEECDPCPECKEPALTIVDATTAHAVLTVHEALSDENKTKFADLPLTKMVDVTWKLVS